MNKRSKALFVLSICLLCALGARVLYFSAFKNEEYTKAVLSQQQKSKPVTAVRGPLYDRSHIPLTDRRLRTLHLTDDARPADGSGKAEFALPSRSDPSGIAAHITGYVSRDGSGLSGVEKKYDSILKSSANYTVTYNADAAGRPYDGQRAQVVVETAEQINGVKLTLDYHIQKIAEDVMNEYITRGAAVILDVQSFDILAMVSRPLYTADNVSDSLSSDGGELLNRALCAYNAGSVFKIVTAAAALEGNPAYEYSQYYCRGSSIIEDTSFPCHKSDGHGLQNFGTAFANSCNIAFYQTGLAVGGKKLTNTAMKLGLGKKVLRWSDEEAEGIIPRKSSYPPLENVNLSIGQGDILITPLQCAVMAATVANGGIRKDVHIADCITDQNGNEISSLRHEQQFEAMTPHTAQTIGAMMRQSVLTGTAKAAADCHVAISGKTGSAETGWQNADGTLAVHGWFCGYFPYENPKYAMVVFCEDGKSGAASCVEPFIKICEEIDKIYPLKQ